MMEDDFKGILDNLSAILDNMEPKVYSTQEWPNNAFLISLGIV